MLEIRKQPFGPKMCEQFCNQIEGQTLCFYSADKLSCRVTGDRNYTKADDEQTLPETTTLRGSVMDATTTSCQQYSRLVHSRNRGLQCAERIYGAGKWNPDVRTSLLIAPSAERLKAPFYKFNIMNNSGQRLALWGGENEEILDIAYSSSLKAIVVAQGKGDLIAINVNSGEETIINQGRLNYHIAVDDVNKYIFAVGVSHEDSVFYLFEGIDIIRMKTDGSSFAAVSTAPSATTSDMVVDSTRKKFFIAMPHKIFFGRYTGRSTGHFRVESSGKGQLAFDVDENVLYYNWGRNMYQMLITTGKVSKIVSLQCRMVDMLYYSGLLYYTCAEDMDIHVMNVVKRKSETLKTGNDLNAHESIISLIP
ncbi:uncharacterized protein LOC124117151 [Haliotis rufescens]|uniref:uncharacterized protein LOC124117151 n=1 Tax=Haliotis rufescens TaxID=6454 RepID=UPI00201EFD29|nr:uncharacterized protein LOC124117151 [Haliotis rufescens]XP_046334852.2 uncharacterized protein LOC124117151 [Haliotis rufescens]